MYFCSWSMKVVFVMRPDTCHERRNASKWKEEQRERYGEEEFEEEEEEEWKEEKVEEEADEAQVEEGVVQKRR